MGYSREQVMSEGKGRRLDGQRPQMAPTPHKRSAQRRRRGEIDPKRAKRGACVPTVNHTDALDVYVERSIRWQFGRRLKWLYCKGLGEDRWSVSGHRQVEYCG